MLELKKAPLMVNRSYSRVLKAAYCLLTDNFKRIFKHMWIYSLMLSCALALYFLCVINTINGTSQMYAFAVMPLLLIAEVLFYARALMPLNGRSMKWNSLRIVKLGVAMLAFVLVLAAIFALCFIGVRGSIKTTFQMAGFLSVISLVTMLLLIPFIYISAKYYMDSSKRLHKQIIIDYKTGIRHWGLQFITTLLAGLAIACIFIVTSLPLIIVYASLVFSLQGEVNGDEAGIPNYFNAITFVAASITYFVTTFMNLYTLYISYYLYGSIETREKEKKEITKTTTQQ